MQYGRATRFTRITGDTLTTVSSGSIVVGTINVANPTGAPITINFTDADDAAVFTMVVDANSTETETFNELFDNGLKYASTVDAAVIITVWHSADGA